MKIKTNYYVFMTALVGSGFLISNLAKSLDKTLNNLERKTQKAIIIDSLKTDTTNYQKTINYFDYNKR